jgi:hypothetical protein
MAFTEAPGRSGVEWHLEQFPRCCSRHLHGRGRLARQVSGQAGVLAELSERCRYCRFLRSVSATISTMKVKITHKFA